ncbi:uncharacterized protein LOC141591675 isoform X1 [Silene latifolia]|uniref:uncharacterized protein LOC141591675 isoform X1 n=2 Tax=Silene latifolia TaxID=37657 RepID=UPI003D782DD8
MALATSRVTVRASWDTQQRLPYNRNSPRKTHKPKSLFLSPSPSKTQSINKSSQLQINVDELLNFNAIAPRQEPVNLDEETYLGYDRWLPRPPKSEKPRSSHNAAALAYIGDCIYELYARRHFLAPALNIEQYNDRVMAVVRCEAQDALLQKLLSDNFLSAEEKDVLRWGKNIGSAKTRTTKRAGVAVYNRASSLETLIGYLYLTNPQRLEDMMSSLGFSVNISNQTILEDLNLELQKAKLKKVGDKVPQPT